MNAITRSQSEGRRELRDLIVLAVPVVLSELGWMAQGVVDNIMVGRLGPEAIGAVSLGNAVYYTPRSSASACCSGSIRWSRRPMGAAITMSVIAGWRRASIWLASSHRP